MNMWVSHYQLPAGHVIEYHRGLNTIRKCARRGCNRHVVVIDNGCGTDFVDEAVRGCTCSVYEVGCERHRSTLVCKEQQEFKKLK